MFPRKICIYSQCQINMTLQILRLLNFNMLTGILKDMEKEKILTKFKLEVHIQRTYYVASNWIWFVLTLNLLEIFRWEKKPRQKQFYKNMCLSLTNFQTPIYLTHLPQQFSYICIQMSSPYMYMHSEVSWVYNIYMF